MPRPDCRARSTYSWKTSCPSSTMAARFFCRRSLGAIPSGAAAMVSPHSSPCGLSGQLRSSLMPTSTETASTAVSASGAIMAVTSPGLRRLRYLNTRQPSVLKMIRGGHR